MIQFFVIGRPQTAGSKSAVPTGRGIRVIEAGSKESRAAKRTWRGDVQAAAGRAMAGQELLGGPLRLNLILVRTRPASHYGSGRNAETLKPAFVDAMPTERPDTVKLTRAIEDALTGHAWRDDSQVVAHFLAKVFGDQVGLGRGVEGAFVSVHQLVANWPVAAFVAPVMETYAQAHDWWGLVA